MSAQEGDVIKGDAAPEVCRIEHPRTYDPVGHGLPVSGHGFALVRLDTEKDSVCPTSECGSKLRENCRGHR
jgi:hypothetical protein